MPADTGWKSIIVVFSNFSPGSVYSRRAADRRKQPRGHSECREAPPLFEILIAGGRKCEERANHGVREARVEGDCFGAEIPEAVLQVLPERGEADRLDGDGQQQSMLLVGITDIDFLWPQTALELLLTRPAPERFTLGNPVRRSPSATSSAKCRDSLSEFAFFTSRLASSAGMGPVAATVSSRLMRFSSRHSAAAGVPRRPRAVV